MTSDLSSIVRFLHRSVDFINRSGPDKAIVLWSLWRTNSTSMSLQFAVPFILVAATTCSMIKLTHGQQSILLCDMRHYCIIRVSMLKDLRSQNFFMAIRFALTIALYWFEKRFASTERAHMHLSSSKIMFFRCRKLRAQGWRNLLARLRVEYAQSFYWISIKVRDISCRTICAQCENLVSIPNSSCTISTTMVFLR